MSLLNREGRRIVVNSWSHIPLYRRALADVSVGLAPWTKDNCNIVHITFSIGNLARTFAAAKEYFLVANLKGLTLLAKDGVLVECDDIALSLSVVRVR